MGRLALMALMAAPPYLLPPTNVHRARARAIAQERKMIRTIGIDEVDAEEIRCARAPKPRHDARR